MSDPIAGGVALVTGGARGIGRALGAALVAEGARVVLCDVDEQELNRTAVALGAEARPLDVRDAKAWNALVAQVERDVGPIGLLVNNAGIMPLGRFLDLGTEVDARQMDVNLWGVVNGMRAVLPHMLRRGRGHVVNIASSAGKVGVPYAAMYSATKHAVIGLTEAVRFECRDSGVDFTYVMPALVDTELISGTRRLRFPPVVSPDEVAAATLRGIRARKVDVFVPRFARLAAVLPALMPRRAYERIGQLFGVDQVFADLDADARKAYVRRAHS